AFDHAGARAQDIEQDHFFAVDARRLHGRERRLDGREGEREIPRDLVREQHADLGQQDAKAARAAILLPEQAELVLYERVTDDGDVIEHGVCFWLRSKDSTVAVDEQRRATAAALLERDHAAGAPRAAF